MPGIALPPRHQQKVQHAQALLWWPAADSAKLRATAHAWRDMARAIDAAHAASKSAAADVLAENQGFAVDAFGAYWQKWSGSTGYLPECSQACTAMATALDRYAQAVDDARRRVEALVAEVGTAVIVGVALSIVTVGISDVAAGAVSAGLIASAAAVGVELSATAAGIAATILVSTTMFAVEAMAIDVAVIQPEKIFIFHDQQGFSWSEVLQWGEMGAAGGLFFGGAGVVFTAVRGGYRAGADALAAGGDGLVPVIDGATPAADALSPATDAGSGITARLSGGAGPVYQGQAGVEQAVKDLEAAGGKVLGREISLDVKVTGADGLETTVRTRIDLFVKLPSKVEGVPGKDVFLEIKTGPEADLTANQTAAFPGVRAVGAIPRGNRAIQAGLTPGVPIDPTEVWIVHMPWPLAP